MKAIVHAILGAALAGTLLSCGPAKPDTGSQDPAGSANQGDPGKAMVDPGAGTEIKTLGAITTKAPDDVGAMPADANRTSKGVGYKVLKPGRSNGRQPRPWDKVKVHYAGWRIDGVMFDSSLRKGQPIEFPLNGVIAGWTDGIPTMREGGATRFWIPKKMAYDGDPTRPEGMLVFDVELLKVTRLPKPPEAPPVPTDVARPPADAKRTAKGVHYKVLKQGTGTRCPKSTDKVEVHYTGWTTDGKLFDSSVTKGKRATFGLNEVIPGWTDGLKVMHVGDKTRFWIPGRMAYDGMSGRPQGMLVFDVELFQIK